MDVVPAPDVGRIWARLDALAAICEPGRPGWTRLALSPWDRKARGLVADWMIEAGLSVRTDAIGNVIGERRGAAPGIGWLVTGSHTDTVDGGGRFDGTAGVVAGLEAAHLLGALPVRHGVRVVVFVGEEPNRFGVSCLGSRAVTGRLEPLHLARAGPDGRSLAEALAESGADPERIPDCRWGAGEVAAFVELHVEQGVELERSADPIGVVTAITAVHRFAATFVGRPDHSGTTPMERRHDALAAAAEAIGAVERSARGGGGVATVGQIATEPGALNVIPASARIAGELRSVDPVWLANRRGALERAVRAAGTRRGVAATVQWLSEEAAVTTDPGVRSAIAAAAERLGLAARPLTSGAGHDAAHLAQVAPAGMVFVPSLGGRSHCPEEWTDPQALAEGVQVLTLALGQLDRTDPPPRPGAAPP